MSLFCLDTDPNCENDAAINVLSNVFGSKFIEGFISQGSPAAAVPNPTDIVPIIFGGLGFVAGMLAVVMIILLTMTSLLTSVQDGEIFGKGSPKITIFSRFTFSMLMVLPTPSAYCVIQIILMFFVLWSNAETNEIYKDVVAASALSNVGMSSNFEAIKDSEDVYGVRGFALAHFAQAYCYNLVNANYYPTSFKAAHGTNDSKLNSEGMISSIYVNQNTRNINAHVLKDANYAEAMGRITTIGLVDAGSKLSKDSKRSVCGGIKIYTPEGTGYEATSKMLSSVDTALGMSTEEQKEIFKAISAVTTRISENKKTILLQTTADVSDWMANANIPYDFSTGATAYRDQLMMVKFDELDKIIDAAVNKGNTEFKYIVQDSNLPTLVRNLTVALTSKGWTYAGGIKQRIITAQSGLSGSLNHPVVSLTKPQTQFLDLHDERVHSFNESLAIARSHIELTLGKQAFATSSDLLTTSENLPDTYTEDSSAEEVTQKVQDGYASFLAKFRRSLTSLLLTGQFDSGTPEAMLTNNLKADWLNADRDVLVNIQQAGEFMMVISTKLDLGLKTMMTASVAATGATGTFDTTYRIAYAVFLGFTEIIAPALTKVLFYMGILSVYMAVILPSMPYFFFITGVVAWYIHILQAMAGMPFWAVMHMVPAKSFVGSQSQGYVTVIGLFMRPMLTLAGLFFGFVLANPILLYVTDTFFAMQENLMTTNSEVLGAGLYQIITELVTFFSWLIIYCTLMLQICYMIFGLAGTLPDSVLKWLGTGLSAGGWGESNAQTAIQSGAKTSVEDSKITPPKKRNGGHRPPGGDNPPDGGGNPPGGGGGNPPGGGGISPTGYSPTKPNDSSMIHHTGVDDAAAKRVDGGNGIGDGFGNTNPGNTGPNNHGAQLGLNPVPPNPQALAFMSTGGVIGADGKPLGNKDLWKANFSRGSEQQVGFGRNMLAGYAAGGALGTIKGIKTGISDASVTAAAGGGIKQTISSFASGMGNTIKDNASQTANFMGHKHLAEKGGLSINNGQSVTFTPATNVNTSVMLGAYQATKKDK